MKGLVVWIDEDERASLYERSLLIGMGYEICSISDATQAMRYFENSSHEGIALIIVDVMLLRGEDMEMFSKQKTNDGNNCGIVLVHELIKILPAIKSKIMFYSRVSEANHVALVKKNARELAIKFLPKGTSTQGTKFVRWLIEENMIST